MSSVVSKPQELNALGNVYALLGRLWLQELDESLLAQFREEPLRSAFSSMAIDHELLVENLDHLAADYCRLFVGPQNHFPPLQSVWQEGKLDSEISASVRSFAAAIQYAPSPDYPNTLIDHLGIELEIMAQIVRSIAEQLACGQAIDESEAFAREFFRRHLCWTDRLLDAAISKTEIGFYHSMLVNTRELLQVEKAAWLS